MGASGLRAWVCVHKSRGSCCYSLSDPRSSRRAEAAGTDCLNGLPRRPHLKGPVNTGQVCTPRSGPAPLLPAPSGTFLHGLDDTSNEALNALLCWVVRMVLGRLGRLWSLPSSAAPLPAPWADLQRLSSSSLLPGRSRRRGVGPLPATPGSSAVPQGPWVPVPSMALYRMQQPEWYWPESLQEGLSKILSKSETGDREPARADQPFPPAWCPGPTLPSRVTLGK